MKKAILSGSGAAQIITIESEIEGIPMTQNFHQRNVMPLSGTVKAVIFNIANDPPDGPILQTSKKGKILPLLAKLDNASLKWKAGEKIRVMYFNEREVEVFVKAKPYFIKRLAEFGDRDDVSQKEYLDFTDEWNRLNPNNQIDACIYIEPETKEKDIVIPKQTKKDDILSIS